MLAGYSTREVAKLVNLPERRIRAYARAGLVGQASEKAAPRRPLRFDFRDLLVLRTAARLLSEGLAPGRVQRALAALRRQIEAERPLSGTQLYQEAGHVVASNGASAWLPESGQFLLRFAAKRVPETTHAPTPLPRPGTTGNVVQFLTNANAPARPPLGDEASTASADTWFDMALELEEADPQRAYELYLRALATDPEHVEATINIGRLCSTSGEPRRAAAYFRQATRMDSAHPVAHFNLAVTLHDLGELGPAADAYRVALMLDPHFADAHYNLATLLEQQGEAEEALRHFQAYRSVCREPSS